MASRRSTNESSARPWRILIVDDHPIVRTGLAALIDAEADLQVCAQAEDYAEALGAIEREGPDLVLVDLSLRQSSGLELLKEVARRGVKAIVVSMHDDPTWGERALSAGARGYVHKSEVGRSVVDAIRKVRAGGVYVSEPLAGALLERQLSSGSLGGLEVERIASLSDRELEVFVRIGKGLTTRQIADELRLSAKTVQTYRERIKEKLALGTAAELSTAATRWVVERASPARPNP